MAKSEAELMEQFEELLKDMRELNHGFLKSKYPQNTSYIDTRLLHLSQIVRRNPEQAEAVLWCADAMWHLLYETAHSGAGVQHRRKDITKITEDKVLQEWNALHKQNPDISKTEAVKEITKNLECVERTVWKQAKRRRNLIYCKNY